MKIFTFNKLGSENFYFFLLNNYSKSNLIIKVGGNYSIVTPYRLIVAALLYYTEF